MAGRQRPVDEGQEIPMNYSFRRTAKDGTGMVASRTNVELDARGRKVVRTHDQVVGRGARPTPGRPSGKEYGLWRTRGADEPADQPRKAARPTADDRIRAKLLGSHATDLQRARGEVERAQQIFRDTEDAGRRGMSDMTSELRRYR